MRQTVRYNEAMRVAPLSAALLCAVPFLWGQNPDIERTTESIQAAIQNGDQKDASRQLDEALARYPREAGFFNLRGVLHAQRSELADARADFQQAVNLAPGLTPALQRAAPEVRPAMTAAAAPLRQPTALREPAATPAGRAPLASASPAAARAPLAAAVSTGASVPVQARAVPRPKASAPQCACLPIRYSSGNRKIQTMSTKCQ